MYQRLLRYRNVEIVTEGQEEATAEAAPAAEEVVIADDEMI